MYPIQGGHSLTEFTVYYITIQVQSSIIWSAMPYQLLWEDFERLSVESMSFRMRRDRAVVLELRAQGGSRR